LISFHLAIEFYFKDWLGCEGKGILFLFSDS
jgi:hypothetical protein